MKRSSNKKFSRRFWNCFLPFRDLAESNQKLENLAAEVRQLRAVVAGHLLETKRESASTDPRDLHRFEAQVCSQNGEDGVIAEIFRRIGTTNQVFLEIGVGDGRENNTAFLLSLGWTGFWVDGNPAVDKRIKESRLEKYVRSKVTFVNEQNIAGLVGELGVPQDLDFLSVDIDQNTYYVWRALHVLKPRVAVIEYNSVIPPSIDWKVNYDPDKVHDGTDNYGASLKALENLGRQLGYSLVHCELMGCNAFFVRNDLVADHFVGPFTAEQHYERPRFPCIHRSSHRISILDRSSPA